MKSVLFLILLLPLTVFGQKLKKIVSIGKGETYNVLAADGKTKHGAYIKNSYYGKPLMQGFYKQGLKDSIWHFYDFDGQIVQKYDYSKKELLFNKSSSISNKKTYTIIQDSFVTDVVLDQPPVFIGGESVLSEKLANSVKYPEDAQRNGVEGIVLVAFIIDTNGKADHFAIRKSVSKSCDAEAIRVAKETLDHWELGKLNGVIVSTVYEFPVRFTIK